MSYILDALKRAEAQRERGAVPGIHAHAGAGAPQSGTQRRNARMVWWSLAGAALVALAFLAWFLAARDARRDAVRNVVAAVPAPLPSAASASSPAASSPAVTPAGGVAVPEIVAVAPSPQFVPPPVMPGQPPAPAVQAPRPATPPARQAAEAAKAPARATSPATPTVTTPVTVPTTAPTTAPSSGPEKAAPEKPRIHAREELPADVRAQLPPVTVNGSTYSANPAHRMLIANGQVFRENEKITPDLTVEQIGPGSAVLAFRGYRYRLPF